MGSTCRPVSGSVRGLQHLSCEVHFCEQRSCALGWAGERLHRGFTRTRFSRGGRRAEQPQFLFDMDEQHQTSKYQAHEIEALNHMVKEAKDNVARFAKFDDRSFTSQRREVHPLVAA